jgi:hypothetical protein
VSVERTERPRSGERLARVERTERPRSGERLARVLGVHARAACVSVERTERPRSGERLARVGVQPRASGV